MTSEQFIELMQAAAGMASEPLTSEQRASLISFRAGLIVHGTLCARARAMERERAARIAEKYDCLEAAVEIRQRR